MPRRAWDDLHSASGWGFPVHHALLGDFQQVAAVLGQQVERVGDVRDVFDVAVFEALAVQGLEQFAGGSDALEGGFEDVLGVGLCVDDQGRGIGEVGLEWAVAIGKRIQSLILVFSLSSDDSTVYQTMGVRTVFGLVNRRTTNRHAEGVPNTAAIAMRATTIDVGSTQWQQICATSGDQARSLIWQRRQDIDVSCQLAIGDRCLQL